MWCLGTWCSGGLGSARLTVGLDDLKGLRSKAENVKDHLKLEGDVEEVAVVHGGGQVGSGAWRCGSLASLRLLDSTTPNSEFPTEPVLRSLLGKKAITAWVGSTPQPKDSAWVVAKLRLRMSQNELCCQPVTGDATKPKGQA
ncbi:hypothetical protein QYF61_009184 [Mycteria americana]|uniref:Uncharacterized protein n=1 Tax=Mycteria americana TaxID=33587 RepID=A0AAN7S2X6_MYCAM|nr:hypothetical protein QYF61_009184 [Mycteria americana]